MSGGHWYTRQGEPCHTQRCKPGAKNAERATDIRDARKLGLLPSVSGILDVMAKDSLTDWKIEQVIEACYRRPAMNTAAGKMPELREYAAGIKEDAFRQVGNAADLGTKIHAALEAYYSGQPFDGSEVVINSLTLGEIVAPVIEAVEGLNIMVVASERVLVNPLHGYGGTCDILWESVNGEKGVLDFKSKATKPDRVIFKPKSHAMQCAAYWQAHFGPEVDYDVPAYATAYNVYCSVTQPGRVEVVKHEDTTLRDAWKAFKHCIGLWSYQNNYWPAADMGSRWV